MLRTRGTGRKRVRIKALFTFITAIRSTVMTYLWALISNHHLKNIHYYFVCVEEIVCTYCRCAECRRRRGGGGRQLPTVPVGDIWKKCFYFLFFDRLAILAATSVFDLTHFLNRCSTWFDDFTNIRWTGAVFWIRFNCTDNTWCIFYLKFNGLLNILIILMQRNLFSEALKWPTVRKTIDQKYYFKYYKLTFKDLLSFIQVVTSLFFISTFSLYWLIIIVIY